MPIDIPAAIATLNGTIQLARGLAEASAELDKAELKLRIVGLVDQLVAAKDSFIDAREEIRNLETEIAQLKETTAKIEDLVEDQDFLYAKDDQGQRTGQPYCPRCLEVDGRLVSMHPTIGRSDWDRVCPQCKNDFLVDKRVRDADYARQTALIEQANRDDNY
jgi:hypothetical protein